MSQTWTCIGGFLLAISPAATIVRAQTVAGPPPDDARSIATPGRPAKTTGSATPSSTAPSTTAASTTAASTTAPSTLAPSTSRSESSIFYFLNMSGRKQSDFRPLTAGEKAKFYTRGLFSPIMLFTAASSAGIAQAKDVPRAWGQGAQGYGDRFGNYFAKQAIQRTLRLGGEELLREDNRYFGSGEHGIGRRVLYALKSSVMARGNDGRQHLSLSEIGSIAGASFLSRTWQPATNNSVDDGLTSFGIGLASNAGINVLREFLPDLTGVIFHRREVRPPDPLPTPPGPAPR